MKKFLALVMAVLLTFSIALVPMAADENAAAEADQITVEEVISAIEKTVILIKDTIEQIHNIVGQIMAVLDKECALCGEIHEIALEDAEENLEEDLVVEMEKVEMIAA